MNSEFILTLLNIPGFGRVKSKTIIDNINHNVGSITELYNGIVELKSTLPKLKVPLFEEIEIAHSNALNILENSSKENIEVTSYLEPKYSRNLLQTNDYPLIIYSKGDIKLLDTNPKIAVIGTRHPSEIGLRLGKRITEILVQHNHIIVSGLALGCDTIAHQTCIDNGGKTIAVMAGGLNEIYPKNNLKLSNDIIESGGLLISEYPIGISPRANFFVERNRIQSGISNGVCVVETDITGGTIRTVEFAEKQNRLIGCVNFNDLYYIQHSNSGNRQLIQTERTLPLGDIDQIMNFIVKLKLTSTIEF